MQWHQLTSAQQPRSELAEPDPCHRCAAGGYRTAATVCCHRKSLPMQIRCVLIKYHFLTLIMNGNLSASLSATSVYYGKIHGNHRTETFNLLPSIFGINIWYLAHSSNNLCSNLANSGSSKGLESADFVLTIRNTLILHFLPPAFFCLSGFIKECKLVAVVHICSFCIILKKQRSSELQTKWI